MDVLFAHVDFRCFSFARFAIIEIQNIQRTAIFPRFTISHQQCCDFFRNRGKIFMVLCNAKTKVTVVLRTLITTY